MDDLDVTPTNVAPVTDAVEEPERAREVVFEIRDGSVHYGANLAVDDVNFDVGAQRDHRDHRSRPAAARAPSCAA